MLSVSNPLRSTFAKVCFILAGIVWAWRIFMWGILTPRTAWLRFFVSVLAFGIIGWVVVELYRFAAHTEPHVVLEPKSIPSNPSIVEATQLQQATSPVASPVRPMKGQPKQTATKREASSRSDQNPNTSVINQTMTNSPNGIQAGRDVTVGPESGRPPSPSPSVARDKKKQP